MRERKRERERERERERARHRERQRNRESTNKTNRKEVGFEFHIRHRDENIANSLPTFSKN